LFDSPYPGFLFFCEHVTEEAAKWEKKHEAMRKGTFRNHQVPKEVVWPHVSSGFQERSPKKKHG